MSETNDWLFFLDESGQEQKESPQIVFGGFGIDASKFEAFKSDIEAAYFDAFGYPLSEKSEELKGKFLLKKKEFKEAGLIPALSDGERKELIAQLRTKNGNSGFSFKMRPAKGQASLLFVENVFKLLKKHECYVVASVTTTSNYDKSNYRMEKREGDSISDVIDDYKKYTQRPKGAGLKTSHRENFTTYLVNDLEALTYRAIFDFCGYKLVSKLELNIDKSSTKQDILRKNHCLNILAEGRSAVDDENTEIRFVDSEYNIGISIADIIIYCVNFGLYYDDDFKQNKIAEPFIRHEINDFVFKNLQPGHYENDFFNLERLTLNIQSPRITQILKSPDVSAKA